jgi:hypothetical protein
MPELAAAIAGIPMPPRIARRPIGDNGMPVPWFVGDEPGADFRVARMERLAEAVRRKLCWVCGEPLGRFLCFTIGPMCGINRISAEPPSHTDCAHYSVRACPFLANPRMRRNGKDMPEEAERPPGIMLEHNPGVTLLWTTRMWTPFRPPVGGSGVLFRMGDPVTVEWFRAGRPASYDDAREAVARGLPALLAMCQKEASPALVTRATNECLTAAAKLAATMPRPDDPAALAERVAEADLARVAQEIRDAE